MRNLPVFLGFLAAVGLAACSGGEGPSVDAGGSAPPPPPATPPPPAAPTTPPAPPLGSLTCSPCKKIVFTSVIPGQDAAASEIYSIDLDSGELTRLTDNQSYDGDPAWSPDGQRIAFVSSRDFDPDGSDVWKRALYVMDADGGNVVRLTFWTDGIWNPAWSPDGSRIVFEAFDSGSSNLWDVPADGGPAQLLFSTPGVDMQPAWSPDGTRLAIVSDWFAYDGVWDIFFINADGSGFSAVTDANIFDRRDYVEPAWSPDGAQIALGVTDRIGTFSYLTQVGLMNANGSGLTLLPGTEGTSVSGESGGAPSWSPDGTTIAYAACDSDSCDLWWIKADASVRGEIVGNAAEPDWQR